MNVDGVSTYLRLAGMLVFMKPLKLRASGYITVVLTDSTRQ